MATIVAISIEGSLASSQGNRAVLLLLCGEEHQWLFGKIPKFVFSGFFIWDHSKKIIPTVRDFSEKVTILMSIKVLT